MPFVSKAVFGERPSKARSLDFMGYDSQAWQPGMPGSLHKRSWLNMYGIQEFFCVGT